jgi:hypothetical protein
MDQLNLPENAWENFEIEPKKDGDPLIWMQRKKANPNATLIYMKIK